jgi:hypothetical protein
MVHDRLKGAGLLIGDEVTTNLTAPSDNFTTVTPPFNNLNSTAAINVTCSDN